MTHADLEIIFNLWYVYDASGTVHALRARCYVLPGKDEDKLAFLEAFASSDYLIARQFPVPEDFLAQDGKGQTTSTLKVENMADPQALNFFEKGMETLIHQFPPQTQLTAPPDPLVNLTPLFLDNEGHLAPVTEMNRT